MPNVLTINAGSSSIRFAIFGVGRTPTRLLQGKLDRIGSGDASLTVGHNDSAQTQIKADIKDPAAAIDFLAPLDKPAKALKNGAEGRHFVSRHQSAAATRV